MGHRTIQGTLAAAKRLSARPTFLPAVRRRKGAKAAGLAYERSIADALARLAAHGPWFEFTDSRGTGWCQPDFILPRKELGSAFVLEAKYTWVPEAKSKLQGLYLPVVAKAFKIKAFGIVICKNLEPGCKDRVVSTLEEAIQAALAGEIPALLWNGRTVLDPHNQRPTAGPRHKPIDRSPTWA